MRKHTSGGWRVSYDSGYFVETEHVEHTSSGTICDLRMPMRLDSEPNEDEALFRDEDEDLANARLIAASPDLLEAAKAAASLIRGSGFTEQTEALILLTAAIKKAEGK